MSILIQCQLFLCYHEVLVCPQNDRSQDSTRSTQHEDAHSKLVTLVSDPSIVLTGLQELPEILNPLTGNTM